MMDSANHPRDRGALSGLLTGVSFLSGLGGALALAHSSYPRPGSDAATIQRYFSESARAARLSATGQLISAAALARFTASAVAVVGRAGAGARPLQAAALGGGMTAAAALATSGLCAFALTGPRGADATDAVALHRRAFAAGGPVHGAAFGVLVGALSVAGLRTGEMPRKLAMTGLVSAAAGLLTPLYFVAEPAGWLIPIGRFSGLAAIAVAGFRLARPAA